MNPITGIHFKGIHNKHLQIVWLCCHRLHQIDGFFRFFDIKIIQTQDVNTQHETDDPADPGDSILTMAIPNEVPVMPVKVGIVQTLCLTGSLT